MDLDEPGTPQQRGPYHGLTEEEHDEVDEIMTEVQELLGVKSDKVCMKDGQKKGKREDGWLVVHDHCQSRGCLCSGKGIIEAISTSLKCSHDILSRILQ